MRGRKNKNLLRLAAEIRKQITYQGFRVQGSVNEMVTPGDDGDSSKFVLCLYCALLL